MVTNKSFAQIFLYGGSMNPPHEGHRFSVLYILWRYPGSHVFVIPCAQRTGKKDLLSFSDRLQMCQDTFGHINEERVHIDDSGEMVVVDILARYRRLYPNADLIFTTGYDLVFPGEDGVSTIHRVWTQGERLWREQSLLVFPRGDVSLSEARANLPENMVLADVPPPDISSSLIREQCRNNLSIAGLVTPAVKNFIETEGFYSERR